MENEKEIEVRKDSFRKFRESIRDCNVFRLSNRTGKNLSYGSYMAAWQHSRYELLKAIIAELDYKCYEEVIKDLYKKLDNIQEEILNHE